MRVESFIIGREFATVVHGNTLYRGASGSFFFVLHTPRDAVTALDKPDRPLAVWIRPTMGSRADQRHSGEERSVDQSFDVGVHFPCFRGQRRAFCSARSSYL